MKTGQWIAAGIGLAAIGGAVAFAQFRDTETPAHNVLIADGEFELREYAPMIVAEVTHSGTRERASSAGFRRLAAYIFAKDRPAGSGDGAEKIAMTAPVMQERVDKHEPIAMTAPVMQDRQVAGRWRTRFVMPSHYSMEELPEPPSDITLTGVPARRMAAVRFSGNPDKVDLSAMERRLADWIAQQGLSAQGTFEYAFYDAPMIPGPLRRNEVMIEVE